MHKTAEFSGLERDQFETRSVCVSKPIFETEISVSTGAINSVAGQNLTRVCTKFFYHRGLGNNLQLRS